MALHFADVLLAFTDNRVVVLLLITVMVLVIGCFMETIAAITILAPVLLPVAVKIGIDPVHFGIILILNLMIGLLTPPVGMVLYVLSKVANVPFERCVVATAPFLIPLVFVLHAPHLHPGAFDVAADRILPVGAGFEARLTLSRAIAVVGIWHARVMRVG